MPDAQTLNSALSVYGLSNLIAPGGFNWANLIGGVIFSIIGWSAFRYGKREKSVRPMAIGAALMIYPYFIANTFLAYVIGIALTAALFLWRE